MLSKNKATNKFEIPFFLFTFKKTRKNKVKHIHFFDTTNQNRPQGIRISHQILVNDLCTTTLVIAAAETHVHGCSVQLMFTNGKIVVCQYMIRFHSNLYFCQPYS
jgi:hypothetical protein